MNKKYFSILVVAIVATVASFNIYSSQKETPMSDLALANVEALAHVDGESGGDPCGGPKVDGECQSRNTIGCRDLTGCK